ncbi:MAG TPA: glycosyltransferase family A protein, partial [Acidimicrobiia bacterium]
DGSLSQTGHGRLTDAEWRSAQEATLVSSESTEVASTLGVVIPTIGDRPELKRLLLTILAQTRPVQAIQVVVDADDTTLVDAILAELQGDLGRTVVEVQRTGVMRTEGDYLVDTGYGYTVNRGLERLDTDLVSFLDDDDEIRPSHFAQLEAALDPSAGRSASYSRVLVVNPDGAERHHPEGTMPAGKIPVGVLIDAHPVLLPATLMHRSVLDTVQSLDQTLDREADTDMIVRLGLATEFAAVDDPTYVYYRVSRKAIVNERVLSERSRMLHKHQSHLTRREKLHLWDPIGRSALRAGFTEIGRDAGEQVISALWNHAPGFLVGWYVFLRGRQTPEFIKRAVKRLSGGPGQ